MIMHGRLIIFAAMLAALPSAVAARQGENPLHRALGAPDDLTITASIRPRIEAIGGQFRPNAARDDALFSIRSTLAVDYHPGAFFIGGELWDVRGYLQSDRSSARTGEVNALEPVQAYIGYDLGNALGGDSRSRITLGRFTQDLGARRFMARQRFRNTTNSFTGAKLDVATARGDAALLFWSMPQHRLPETAGRVRANAVVLDHEGTDLQFFGGSYTRARMLGGKVQLYGFGLIERDTPRFMTTNRRLFTPGIRAARDAKAGTIDYDVEATYQGGHARRTAAPGDRKDVDVSAYFLHVEAGYRFAAAWSPRIALQYDLASGDKAGGSRITRFDSLFGVRREYGPTGLYGLFQRANISSPAVRLEAKPGSRTDGYITYRAGFLSRASDSFAASGIRDPAGSSGKFAGHQIEAGINHMLVPGRVKLSAGAIYLAKARFLETAPNAPSTGDTVYGFSDVTFSF